MEVGCNMMTFETFFQGTQPSRGNAHNLTTAPIFHAPEGGYHYIGQITLLKCPSILFFNNLNMSSYFEKSFARHNLDEIWPNF